MPFVFPVTRLEYGDLLKMGFDEGLIGFGLVQEVEQDGETYYAILDGGWWAHPGLRQFLGQRIGIALNTAKHQVEVTEWPDYAKVLAILRRSDWTN